MWLIIKQILVFVVCYERFVGAKEEDGIFDIGWLDSTIGDLVNLQEKLQKQIHGYGVEVTTSKSNAVRSKLSIPCDINSMSGLQH